MALISETDYSIRPASQGARYITYLDGLRAVACLMVAFNHFPYSLIGLPNVYYPFYTAREYLGVDIFSVLSGFIVYYTYRQRSLKVNPSFKEKIRFIFRRIKRIYSLVIPACVIGLAVIVKGGMPVSNALLFGVRQLGFIGSNFADAPYWSLINEILFYLISPFLLYPLIGPQLWKYTRWLMLFVVSAFIAWYYCFVLQLPFQTLDNVHTLRMAGICINIADGWLVKNLLWFDGLGSGFERMFFEYILGMFAAAFFLNSRKAPAKWISTALGTTILGLLAASIYLTEKAATRAGHDGQISGYDMDIYLIILLATYMIFSHTDDIFKKALSLPPVQYIGRISYSIYFMHLPLRRLFFEYFPTLESWSGMSLWKQIAFQLFYLLLVVTISTATYLLFERYFLFRVLRYIFAWLSGRIHPALQPATKSKSAI